VRCYRRTFAPGENISGNRRRRTGITKVGSPAVRRAPVQAAWVYWRCRTDNPMGRWVTQLAARRRISSCASSTNSRLGQTAELFHRGALLLTAALSLQGLGRPLSLTATPLHSRPHLVAPIWLLRLPSVVPSQFTKRKIVPILFPLSSRYARRKRSGYGLRPHYSGLHAVKPPSPDGDGLQTSLDT
jgi:hypothetical protein